LELREIIADYEILARQGINLNKSYLEMLRICNELSFESNILGEEKDRIFKIIESMKHDQNIVIGRLLKLGKLIQTNTINIADQTVAGQFQLIAQDCQTIIDFTKSIDLVELYQDFTSLIY
jgi:hypothetical protein